LPGSYACAVLPSASSPPHPRRPRSPLQFRALPTNPGGGSAARPAPLYPHGGGRALTLASSQWPTLPRPRAASSEDTSAPSCPWTGPGPRPSRRSPRAPSPPAGPFPSRRSPTTAPRRGQSGGRPPPASASCACLGRWWPAGASR